MVESDGTRHSETMNFSRLALLTASAGAFALGEPLLALAALAAAFIAPSFGSFTREPREERHRPPYVSTITEYESRDFT